MAYEPTSQFDIFESDIPDDQASPTASLLALDKEEILALQREINREEELAVTAMVRRRRHNHTTRPITRLLLAGVTPQQRTSAVKNSGNTDDKRAACADDPELFIPPSFGKKYLKQIEEAKAICRTCGILNQCRIDALKSDDKGTILGEMTPDERKKLKA